MFEANDGLAIPGATEVIPKVMLGEGVVLLLLLLPQATKDSPMNASPKVLKKLFLFMIILLRK